ncbi:LysR family transcriptional regulator [Azospirillum sp. ST 5-10]|uniref:LysR family transcriptional regulator n=1 Tax=Azospirillum sp. ST 5-10 TaxID=3445776 RepID=UPI003F4A5097
MMKNERLPLDSDLLRTFLAVAEAGNVTHAAAALGRTQSAISVQVRKLETTLGTALFRRQARGMALTPGGEALVGAARRALGEIDRIAGLFAAPLAGPVAVGIPDDHGPGVLASVLATFAARHPEVEVSVRCAVSTDFPGAVRRGELDLAVHAAPPEAAGAAPLLTEDTVWAAHPRLPLAPGRPVPLALFDRACWWRDAALAALAAAGRPCRVAYSSESAGGVTAAVAACLAVGVFARSTVPPGLRVLDGRDGFPPLPASSLVLLRRSGGPTPAVAAMEEAIRTALAGPGRR